MATRYNGFTADIDYVDISPDIAYVNLSADVSYANITAEIFLDHTSEFHAVNASDITTITDVIAKTIGLNVEDNIIAIDTEPRDGAELINGSMLNTHILGNGVIPAPPNTAITITII